MSLSRHFQFVLSQNEAGAIARLNKNRQVSDPPYFFTPLHRDDEAHLRNVLDRLHEAYEAAGAVKAIKLNTDVIGYH